MTAKELRDLLRTLPDDMPVVTNGYDHTFHPVHGSVRDAIPEGHQSYGEWYRGQVGNPIKVLCLGAD